MLIRLFKMRLRYYRNYIRYHFDRPTILLLTFIILVLVLLTGRSPADIGYSLEFLQRAEFPARWQQLFIQLLLAFYLLAEIFAFLTLRLSQEWSLLGTLPISRTVVLNYILLRHLAKSSVPILLTLALFWVGPGGFLSPCLRSLAALSGVLFLHLYAFLQAYHWYQRQRPGWQRMLRWLGPELLIWSMLWLIIHTRRPLQLSDHHWLLGLGIATGLTAVLLLVIYRACFPARIDGTFTPASKRIQAPRLSTRSFIMKNVYPALLYRDFLYLRRQNRSFFLVLIFGAGLIFIIGAFQPDAQSAAVAFLFAYGLFSFILINLLLKLFSHDRETVALVRVFNVGAGTLWLARWLFAALMLTLPIVITILMLVLKFGLAQSLLLALLAALVFIPAVFATLYCCAGFGLFPYINFATLMLNISLLFIVLLWFFVPFGSVLIIFLWIVWIPRSLRHFRKMEVL